MTSLYFKSNAVILNDYPNYTKILSRSVTVSELQAAEL